jgi:hypothetical protein
MSKFVRRLAVVIVSALAPMAFVALVTPGVSSACDSGSWWDPVANVCRAPVAPTPLGCDNGWWWDPVANVCRAQLVS